MKSKHIFLIVIITMYYQLSYGQFKVLPSGDVGIGTNNPIGKLHVNGRIFLTGNGHSLNILPDNPGVEIQSSTGQIIFWHGDAGLTNLYAKKYYKGFPDKSKQNTQLIDNCLETIMKLEGITYQSNKTDTTTNNNNVVLNNEYGFTEENIENVCPEIISHNKGIKFIEYDAFIPILVEAIKEQQQQIEILQQIVYSQENELINLKSTNNTQELSQNVNDFEDDKPVLYDNVPNPFNTETEIKYYIPENTVSASIIIYDLQGREMKSFNIQQKGNGNIIIKSSELYAGMFIYTLIVDNKIIDTKRMILTSN